MADNLGHYISGYYEHNVLDIYIYIIIMHVYIYIYYIYIHTPK
jgi:hypothetical protein